MFSKEGAMNATQFTPEVLNELLKGCSKPEDVIGENGLLKQLTKALLEAALKGELTSHLGYGKHERGGTENARNGTSEKTIQGEFGKMKLNIPRDRNGEFEPQILPKHQTRFTGFDKKILSMYARGMTQRDIRDHLEEIYGVEVSAELISNVTDAVVEELKAWQSRPLEPIYPILFLDALHVKMRH